MNIVTGSAGGLGKFVYEQFTDNNKEVLGLDIVDSPSTDLKINLADKNEIRELFEKIDSKVESITFSHAVGNSINNLKKYDETYYRFVNAESNFYMLDQLQNKLKKEASIIFISSVHSQLTNNESSNYALSKVYLEGLYRRFCLQNNPTNIRKSLIRLGAMDTNMLRENIDSIDQLTLALPSKNLINPDVVADFIFNFHSKYKLDFDCSILQIDNGVGYQLSTF